MTMVLAPNRLGKKPKPEGAPAKAEVSEKKPKPEGVSAKAEVSEKKPEKTQPVVK
jgi:hypothetical protein